MIKINEPRYTQTKGSGIDAMYNFYFPDNCSKESVQKLKEKDEIACITKEVSG